tara:strand:+ start:298 stop:993 length:696 start_codon:yes stop_codon:yes gene_type:complete
MKFSIAIPTYEAYGNGHIFVDRIFKCLSEQTFQNFEIVISDHSVDDKIKAVCNSFSKKLTTHYFKNEINRGNCSFNINKAIKLCEGEYIKLFFQDDYFCQINALEVINKATKSNPGWVANGSLHSAGTRQVFNPFIPKFTMNMYEGNNTISSPSVITIKNCKNIPLFDETLSWMMDIDYYYKLYNKFGLPEVIEDPLVMNFLWEGQLTHTIPQERKNKEISLMKERYEQKK